MNPNAKIFSDMFSDMGRVFSDLWGDSYELTLSDGRKVAASAIFKPLNEERQLTDYGVSQNVAVPRLDINRSDLILATVFEPEFDLDGASVVIENKTYLLTAPRDDGRVMVRCNLSLSAQQPPQQPAF